MKTRTLSASDFKARCLRILDELGVQGVVITKRGRPVARLTPIRDTDNTRLYGFLKGKVQIKGDLFSTGVKWNAQS